MSTPRASLSFDPGPLVEPVDGNAVREHAQRLAHSGSGSGSGALIPVVIGGAFVLIFGSVFLTVIGTIVGSLGSTGSEAPFLISAFVGVLPTILVLAAAAVVIVLLVRGGRRRKERRYRLDRFATANGMSYLPTLAAPALPGMIFGVGRARSASDLVRGERPRFVEFANYQYTTGSGKNRTTHRWGYVAIKLDVPLPHIVLDATSNNGLFGSNLPATFDKDQRLSLEGDFDRHFSLYCPEGYERDALYLFTPDIMARFIDNAAALDVEIVDDWLFLYGKREFSGLDPATWAWLFSVVGALLDKFAQWARWRDERLRADAAGSAPGAFPLADGGFAESSSPTAASAGPGALPFAPPGGLLRPPPGVAAPGRRLTRGVSWVSIVAVGGVVLFWLLSQSGVLRLLFFR
ncbi:MULTISPECIES: hypothetical protein [unclassified Microbacterium]|uniref:hypothetical protein n=1 Tax=unclassified Microbacterium TaxID=2609290 RepID=UPI00214CB0CC|nr:MULTISPECIES: hypothetical protein [unclassified Microbacterium]MCR2808325.1 hypothetical protein [Microbacterium sp. zg.B185]WIM19223.1 hypothetical protein QNO12_16885 [Microbacterium sp. zg-B185]